MNGPIKSQFHVNEKNIQMERKKTNERNLVTLTNEILITNDKS